LLCVLFSLNIYNCPSGTTILMFSRRHSGFYMGLSSIQRIVSYCNVTAESRDNGVRARARRPLLSNGPEITFPLQRMPKCPTYLASLLYHIVTWRLKAGIMESEPEHPLWSNGPEITFPLQRIAANESLPGNKLQNTGFPWQPTGQERNCSTWCLLCGPRGSYKRQWIREARPPVWKRGWIPPP
jgi:hypothetical protein